ncbi:MAG: hypothetical protein MZV63_00270 [Marinilabiliales bacterium]|nr:hypothetical protein [Marinilabiliales bacterium]
MLTIIFWRTSHGHQDDYPILSIAAYPVDRNNVAQLVDSCEKVLVLEEGYPHDRGAAARPARQGC